MFRLTYHNRIALRATFLCAVLFQCLVPYDFAQSRPPRSDANGYSSEIRPDDISDEFLELWDYKSVQKPGESLLVQSQKQIRIIYLIPSDKQFRNEYKAAVSDAWLHLQEFFRQQMGNGYSFILRTPIVDVYHTSHPASWYAANQSRPTAPHYLWFWENALADGFSLSGGALNDPNNRWVFYIDAEVGCGQIIGGNGGVAIMAANDMRGLTGGQNIPSCVGESPDNAGRFRWIGGAGHELAHAFNVPHPPGCGGPGPAYGCSGGSHAAESLMWVGYWFYPNTYLLAPDKTTLFNSGFFYNTVSVGGRVTRQDGKGIYNARVSITGSDGQTRYSISNPFGYYRFTNVVATQNYTINASHKWHQFQSRQVTVNANLTDIDFVSE